MLLVLSDINYTFLQETSLVHLPAQGQLQQFLVSQHIPIVDFALVFEPEPDFGNQLCLMLLWHLLQCVKSHQAEVAVSLCAIFTVRVAILHLEYKGNAGFGQHLHHRQGILKVLNRLCDQLGYLQLARFRWCR
jgi:hypothetical protein